MHLSLEVQVVCLEENLNEHGSKLRICVDNNTTCVTILLPKHLFFQLHPHIFLISMYAKIPIVNNLFLCVCSPYTIQ